MVDCWMTGCFCIHPKLNTCGFNRNNKGGCSYRWLPLNRASCPPTNWDIITGVVGRYGVISSDYPLKYRKLDNWSKTISVQLYCYTYNINTAPPIVGINRKWQLLLQWTVIPYGEKFSPFARLCILQDGLTTHSTMAVDKASDEAFGQDFVAETIECCLWLACV